MKYSFSKSENLNKINDLFESTNKYRKSSEFQELLNFCKKFRYLSPYNAMLVQIQRPGATFVNTAQWWYKKFHTRVKPNANPMVILVPFGPVDFVFDISDLENDNLNNIPKDIIASFKTSGKISSTIVNNLNNNLKYYGIKIASSNFGNQRASSIQYLDHPTST